MRFLLVLLVITGFTGWGITLDTPLDLARPAFAWSLLGVDLAIPGFLANPGALPFRTSLDLTSTFSSLFGVVRIWAASLGAPGFCAEGILVDGGLIEPNLSYQVWAGRIGMGLALGDFGLGGQLRILRPAGPQALLGGALDLGIFWTGPVYVGIVAESLASLSPYPGEKWPTDLSLALVWQGDLQEFLGVVGVGFMDFLSLPTWVLAGALDFRGLELALGLREANLSFGGRVRASWFSVEWAFSLHPDLPLSFRVSFVLRWP
ncbi:hypothetical protein H5T56_06235 [Candidatus Bipolaricaulota bacterium]|nr:hypothetical protein [Candidatus Bipolaricaulota bacterium]